MSARIHELQAAKAEKWGALQELLAAAMKDKRPLNEKEAEQAEPLEAELDRIVASLRLEQKRIDHERNGAPADTPEAAAPKEDQRPKNKSAFHLAFGEYLQAVAHLSAPDRVPLRTEGAQKAYEEVKAAASGMSSTGPGDAGVLVRTEFSTRLLEKAQEAATLWPDCEEVEIGEGFDGLEAPYIDETSRANGSRWGGVQVFRRAEADTVTAKRPKLATFDLRLEDIMGLAYATERSLQDARVLGQLIEKAFSSEMAFKVDDEVFRGTGVGQCLGLYPGDAAGEHMSMVAKEGGQAPDTVTAPNVQKMFARIPPRLLMGAKWYINMEIWPQLFGMNQANMPVFMPGNSMANAPYGLLLGRPISPIEQASKLGDVGDINLANMKEFMIIKKGGVEVADSVHVRFLYGEKVFRFTLRINGAPVWRKKVTPYKANAGFTVSAFVGLEERA